MNKDDVLKAVYASGLHQYSPQVLHTSWKDGIDIDEPSLALMNFVEKISKVEEKKIKSCKWEQDSENNYETECDHLYCIIEGTPVENEMTFCPFCGGNIIQELFV